MVGKERERERERKKERKREREREGNYKWSIYIKDLRQNQAIEDRKFDVTIVDSTDQMGLLSLQGPCSRDILQRVTDTDLGDEAFPFSTSQLISV